MTKSSSNGTKVRRTLFFDLARVAEIVRDKGTFNSRLKLQKNKENKVTNRSKQSKSMTKQSNSGSWLQVTQTAESRALPPIIKKNEIKKSIWLVLHGKSRLLPLFDSTKQVLQRKRCSTWFCCSHGLIPAGTKTRKIQQCFQG